MLIGLASSGLHSNGFSLVRKVVERAGADLAAPFAEAWPADAVETRTLGEVLLAPTRIYVRAVRSLLERVEVKGMAHITGGGLTENTHRMFPDATVAELDPTRWRRPPLFDWLADAGGIAEDEMRRTFNCGIGFVLVVAPAEVDAALAHLGEAGETASVIGTVRGGASGPATTRFV